MWVFEYTRVNQSFCVTSSLNKPDLSFVTTEAAYSYLLLSF